MDEIERLALGLKFTFWSHFVELGHMSVAFCESDRRQGKKGRENSTMETIW